MKVCLVIPKGIAYAKVSWPHGLLSITAMVKQSGHSCEIFDCNDTDRKISYEYFNTFDVVGLSVMTTQLQHAVEIANNLGKHVKVIWGGVHCLLDPLSIVNKYKTHFVVSGEGEIPFKILLDYFTGNETLDFLSKQRGISFYLDQPVINPPYFNKNLDELPDINYYDLPNLEKYIYRDAVYIKSSDNLPTLEMITSRGCTWDCSFCMNTVYKKHHAFRRSKSFDKVRRETEKIIDDYKIKVVTCQDDDFFANRKILDPWVNYALEKGFFWGVSGRYNYFKDNMITPEKLKYFVDSGLFYLAMSIETGSEDLRNSVINKKLKNEEIYKAVRDIQQSVGDRVMINTSFIIDFPGDTNANKIETIKWMNFLSSNLNITLSGPQVYRPYPGSRLFDLEYKHKHKYGDLDYYLKYIGSDGEFGTELDYTSYFYSKALVYYFNWRSRFFKIRSDKKHSLEIIRPTGWVGKVLFDCLFISINLRLKWNYWKLFYEPPVIGWIWCSIRKSMQSNLFRSILQKIKK